VHFSGIVVPGGFGNRGVEGKILACKYSRENKVPLLGICLGMQCAAIEYARNVCSIDGANSTEFNARLAPEQQIVIEMLEHAGAVHGMGASQRLGKRTTVFLTEKCMLRKLYNNKPSVDERHRHRYEVNPAVVPKLSRAGLHFVGMGVDETATETHINARTASSDALVKMAEDTTNKIEEENLLSNIERICTIGGDGANRTAVRMEIVELKGHPYFIGVQYHPEYLSHPLEPSPPFFGLVLAASGQLDQYLNGTYVPQARKLLTDTAEEHNENELRVQDKKVEEMMRANRPLISKFN
jgi:CTP synthase